MPPSKKVGRRKLRTRENRSEPLLITTFLPQFNAFIAKGDWHPLRIFENKKIVEAVQIQNKIFAAIDSFGVHHINTNIKNELEGKRVLRIIGRPSKLYFLTGNSCTTLYLIFQDDGVYGYTNEFTSLYQGQVKEIHVGGEHSIIVKSDGYFAEGANEYCQFAMDTIECSESYVKSETLSAYPIKQLYLGGWHSYAKLGTD
jgi:hypothetical protein